MFTLDKLLGWTSLSKLLEIRIDDDKLGKVPASNLGYFIKLSWTA